MNLQNVSFSGGSPDNPEWSNVDAIIGMMLTNGSFERATLNEVTKILTMFFPEKREIDVKDRARQALADWQKDGLVNLDEEGKYYAASPEALRTSLGLT